MIARRIDRDAAHDNYRALALYVADATIGGFVGEKTLHHWYTGGEAESYLEGLIEVEATQALNTTAAEVKTYHLVVSFRPKDEDKLTRATLEDIERMYAEALGFAEHQRHCGVHINTNNWHMHIAYNRVNPRNLNCFSPYYDFQKLSRASRDIEKKYGLVVDNGMETDVSSRDGQAGAKVKALEAHSGQESLFSYVMKHKADLMSLLDQAENWADAHGAFLQYGLLLKPSGNGLTIKDRHGQHRVKPSDIDRNLSKAKLEKRFGRFEPPSAELLLSITAIEAYTAAPLQKGAERDNLYARFQADLARRKEALSQINQDNTVSYNNCRERWDKRRQAVEKIPMLKRDRQRIRLELKKRAQADLERLRADIAARRSVVRAERPYSTWNQYLQHQATLGDETALAILRSKQEVVPPEKNGQPPEAVPWPTLSIQASQDIKMEIAEAPGVADKHRQALLAVVKMREVLAQASRPGQAIPEFKYNIDSKGTVIFRLADGGAIRDTGREILFSANNDKAHDLARKYAVAKWGQLAEYGPAVIKLRQKDSRLRELRR